MKEIKMLLLDIDGVITDGRKYTDGENIELKSIAFKDLDAFQLIKDAGYKIGCVSGEDTNFNRKFVSMWAFDYVKIGCKKKECVIEEIKDKLHISPSEICYIGDGKYDIPVLKKVKLAICPNDAIDEVKKLSDIILKRKGGEGCIAEIFTILANNNTKKESSTCEQSNKDDSTVMDRMLEHQNVLNAIINDLIYIDNVQTATKMIIRVFRNDGRLFLCGNGGSAADAQHLAAELVGRFYLERKALNAEALTTNTSILTALGNDYDYASIYERQLEAKAMKGDMLIGITTSGTSENIVKAFHKAKKMQLHTILMTGNISGQLPILKDTDCLLAVPCKNVPRIQEMHILTGHIMCEIIEREMI